MLYNRLIKIEKSCSLYYDDVNSNMFILAHISADNIDLSKDANLLEHKKITYKLYKN